MNTPLIHYNIIKHIVVSNFFFLIKHHKPASNNFRKIYKNYTKSITTLANF
ncbi:hypothetical protein Hanom_Chr02g00146461 [Helianthus anomalus]